MGKVGGKMTKTTFNGWIMEKITRLLKNHEGMETCESEYTLDGIKTIVTDSFGYRYEIQVKALGRLGANIENLKENPYYADAVLQKSIKTQE